ncbi:T9SS type A sorting domain-containing protein [bacterium]|nr:T9SS type A sorting domain-containing protein [bacterium]
MSPRDGTLKLILVALLVLACTVGSFAANDARTAPPSTYWSHLYGTDTESQFSVGGIATSDDDVVVGGKSQNLGLLLGYENGGADDPQTLSIAAGTVSVNGFAAAANNDYVIVGQRLVTETDARGKIWVQDYDGATHTAVWNRAEGAVNDVLKYYDAEQITGGTYANSFAVVGYSDANEAGVNDILVHRYPLAGTTPADSRVITAGGTREEARAVAVDGSGNVYIVGLQGDAGSQDFYFNKLDEELDDVANYPFDISGDADISADGTDDVLNDCVLSTDGNTLYVAGNTAATGGFVAAIDVSGATADATWEYTKAGVSIQGITLLSNGDLAVVGQSGDDVWLAEINADGSEDWTHTYTESGRTGAIGYSVYEAPSGKLFVAGQADGATSGTDVLMVMFDEPLSLISGIRGTGNDAIRIDVISGVYADRQNYLVFDDDDSESALDTFEDNDVPEPPPAFGGEYIQAYFVEADATPSNLQENWVSIAGDNPATTAQQHTFEIKTSSGLAGEEIILLFGYSDAANSGIGALLWDDVNNEFVNMASTNTFSYTAGVGAPATKNFFILMGDATPPTGAENYPVDAGDDIAKFTPNANSNSNNLEVDFSDDTLPIVSVMIEYSSNAGVAYDEISISPVTVPLNANFTDLTGVGNNDRILDDGEIDFNAATLTEQWIPGNDSADELLTTVGNTTSRIKFTLTDAAGNSTEIENDDNFDMVGDFFSYNGTVNTEDYNTIFTSGWHLISTPLEPTDALPSDVFTAYDDNGTSADRDDDTEGIATTSGVLDGLDLMYFDHNNGNLPVTDINNGYGYWLYLDMDNVEATGGDPEWHGGLGEIAGTSVHSGETFEMDLDPDAFNYIGVPLIPTGGNTFTPDEFEFSTDDGATWVSYDDAVTNTLIQDNINRYNHAGSAYAAILKTAAMTLGRGYVFPVVTTGAIKMRAVYADVALDAIGGHDNPYDQIVGGELDDDVTQWNVPVSVSLNGLESNDLSIGVHPEATNGFDNMYDMFAPGAFPADYVFAAFHKNDVGYNGNLSSWFRTDVRAPIAEPAEGEIAAAEWKLYVMSNQEGEMTVSFDIAAFTDIVVPAGFNAIATVNELEFNLAEGSEFTFDYSGDSQMIDIVITYDPTMNAVGDANSNLPDRFELKEIYPNPFNPTTSVRVAIPITSNLQVSVFNTLGREVATLHNGRMNAGYHTFLFDGSDFASGVYFIQARVPGQLNEMRKVVLTK